MKKLYLFSLFSLFSCSAAFTQIQPLTGNELPGLQLVDTETYSSESMQNFYSDEAPLISEYGFNRLLVQKFILGGQNIRLEAYFMNTPEAAFGLYSISMLKCQQTDSMTSFDCLTQHQYTAAYGRYNIVITNEDGTQKSQQMCYTLAGKFMLLNPQTPMRLPEVFNTSRFDGNRDQIDFICGMQGMQNSLLPWQNLIIGIRFAMYAVILPDPRGEIYFAQITFPSQSDMDNFLTRANLMRNGIPVQAYNPNTFVFREFVPLNGLAIYFLECVQPVAIAEVTEE